MPLRRWSLTLFSFLGISVTLYAAGQNNDIILHRFKLSDGAGPQGSLIVDAQGNLYGTTYAGGNGVCTYNELPSGCGTIFELSQMSGGGWSEQTLYEFQGGSDGALPMAGLVFDHVGNLYGTTSAGGISSCGFGPDAGCGTVFELSPSPQPGGAWSENVIYRFTNGSDGSSPQGSLVFDTSGNLYGNSRNGPIGAGATFELTPPTNGGQWVETTLHTFDPSLGDGSVPTGSLVFDTLGNLYGTTGLGGSGLCGGQGCGTVFQLKPPKVGGGQWTETVIHVFNGVDGEAPGGNLIWVSGNLVGTAFGGGLSSDGLVFEITQTAFGIREIVLYAFQGSNDGASPQAGLVVDSTFNLYGATLFGGGGGQSCPDGPGCGTVFKLSPPQSQGGEWTETILYSFHSNPDGNFPAGGLLLGNGWVVGMTQEGGGNPNCTTGDIVGCGTVFAVRQ